MISTAWVILAISILFWVFLFPEGVFGVITELKRRLRLRLIRRAGEYIRKVLERKLHQFAMEHNLEQKQVEQVLLENHDRIVHRIGEKWADQILGEADPTERFY